MGSCQLDAEAVNAERKIGIMGGTFNPIHNGHLLIAENAMDQYQLDKIYFIPTGPSPHKGEQTIAAAQSRYEMIERAIYGNPGFAVSTIEIDSVETSYTCHTLEKLTFCILTTGSILLWAVIRCMTFQVGKILGGSVSCLIFWLQFATIWIWNHLKFTPIL